MSGEGLKVGNNKLFIVPENKTNKAERTIKASASDPVVQNPIKAVNIDALTKQNIPQIVTNLDANTKQALIKNLKNSYKELSEDYKEIKDHQGFIGKAWNGLKNLTGLGAGSKKVDKKLEELNKNIAQLEKNPDKLPEMYEKITGKKLTTEELEKIQKGENVLAESEAAEKVKGFKEGQEMAVDVVADLAAGIASVGIFVAATAVGIAASPFTGGASLLLIAGGFAIAGTAGAAIKTGIKYADAKSGGREYDSLGYDLATGGFAGVLAPVTGGLGGAVGKTVFTAGGKEAVKEGSKLVLKEAVKETAVEGTKQAAKEGVKHGLLKTALLNPTGYEYAGSSFARKGLAYGAEFATDGALGGGADNGFRYLLTEENKSLGGFVNATAQGTVGGLVMAPVIGGGFKLAGKGCREILGTPINKKWKGVDENPFASESKQSKRWFIQDKIVAIYNLESSIWAKKTMEKADHAFDKAAVKPYKSIESFSKLPGLEKFKDISLKEQILVYQLLREDYVPITALLLGKKPAYMSMPVNLKSINLLKKLFNPETFYILHKPIKQGQKTNAYLINKDFVKEIIAKDKNLFESELKIDKEVSVDEIFNMLTAKDSPLLNMREDSLLRGMILGYPKTDSIIFQIDQELGEDAIKNLTSGKLREILNSPKYKFLTSTEKEEIIKNIDSIKKQNGANLGKAYQFVNFMPNTKEIERIRKNLREGIDIIEILYSKGKSHKIPVESLRLYIKTRNLEGTKFIETVYEQLVKDMGYEGASPKLIIGNEVPSAAFSMPEGKVYLNPEYSCFQTKGEIVEALAHEFEHFRQYADVARTRGRGIESVARAHVKGVINESKNGIDKNLFNATKDFTPEQWTQFEEGLYNNLFNEINTDLYEKVIEKKGYIEQGTEQATKTDKYLKAFAGYVSAEENWSGYKNNLTEKEAYKTGKETANNYLKAENFLQT